MPGVASPNPWSLSELLGQKSILGVVVLITWLVLFHLLVNVWLLCIFTSLLVVLGGWLGSRVALDANSLLHLEHFLPLGESPQVHTASESEQRLDWEIQSAVDKAVRDFVSSWYCSSVSKGGDEFEREVRDAMLEAAAELKRRAKQVDRRALAQRVLELCGCHLQSFTQARKLQRTLQEESDQSLSNSQKLWRLYSIADLPHPALTGPANQLCYSRALVDLLMHVLIPKSHLETRTGRYMVGELITCNVLLPLVARISSPDWLNQTIVDVFTQSTDKEETSPQQTPPADLDESHSSFWDSDSPITLDCPETSSMQTAWSVSTAPLHDSSETSFHSQWSSDENVHARRSSSILFPERIAQNTAELLRSPYRTSRLYRHTDFDLESPSSDERQISSESLKRTDTNAEDFCDCISPSDFCGLVCLEEDTLGLLGKCFGQNMIASEPPSRLESTMEESPVRPLTNTSNSIPRSLGLDSLVFENLGNLEGPVTIQNLQITGTITAKEQRSNSTHPYTLYTVKFETTSDCSDQPVMYHMVNRRYTEFLNLQTRLEERPDLKKLIKNVKGPKKLFPDLPFSNLDTDKVEARRSQLESFLRKLCSIPEAANSEEMQEFLALNTDATAAFQKKPSSSRIDKMVENIVDTLKTAFPRPEPQSPIEEGDPQRKPRLRFSSKIAPTLNIPSLQPKVTYSFSERCSVLRGFSLSDLEGFVEEQEKLVDGGVRSHFAGGRRMREQRSVEKRGRGADTALADIALNILCLLMKDQWSWLCTENIQKTIRLLFGTFIERWLDVGIAHLTSSPCWVIYLRVLQDAVWPGGELPVVPRPERSPEQREKTRLQCLHCLMQLFPELITDMLGSEKFRLVWEHVLESLQDPSINRHLVYCIFDLLLEFLVPEFSEETFQRSLLQSLPGDIERTPSS
ncbi:sorting nexin-19a isoform X1 [Ctenopharyngodon idella]|uniref:sorting nexin-19a isoform X1 n=2 Tax=Ctenopharyngodon idella TaxID=7959 RepID=UPI00223165BE|nr:sorting nexin-19a isoform X1 [Ctenopharyngodon idella]XP_051748537.1 sorting nexin-19a isoform X1 [Ctenopharyngodon idella]